MRTRCSKRNYPPGQHGLARKRKKVSEYGTQLSEKQKAKYTYGLLEKQFSRTYEQAARMGSITRRKPAEAARVPSGQRGVPSGHRPDARRNPSAGFALPYLRERRCGEHPSFSLRAGDVVSVREKSKSLEVISASLSGATRNRYAWLEWDGATMSGKFLQKPEREEIPENIKEQLIVELYSK